MSEQDTTPTTPTTEASAGGCRCGCGGHGRRAEEERAAAPAVVQPLAEGYEAPADEPSQDASSGVVPGRKAGNLLGLRDVSAPARTGGCGCGGHGHGGGRGCGCGSH